MTPLNLPDLPDALCTQVDQGDIFFPDQRDNRTTALARSICASCAAALPCLTYALTDPSLTGVPAGTTVRDRQALRRERAA